MTIAPEVATEDPELPPVPVVNPMVRCTVRRCRNRQNWKASSMSTRSSQVA